MTATVFTLNDKTMFFNNIVKVDRVGTHTYEFTQFINRNHSRVRVTDVAHLLVSEKCQCHNDTDYERLEVPYEYRNTET